MCVMTPRTRTVTYVTAAALVLATTLGCGLLGAAKKLAGNLSTISDFSDKLQKGLTLTYRATYKDQDGKTVTVQQQPPNSVYITDTGPLIITADAVYACDNSGGVMTCDKQTITSSADANAALAASSLGQAGYMGATIGIGLLVAASVVPAAKVTKYSKKIAGQNSDCVRITNLDPSSDGGEDFKNFDMCITDAGIVSLFSGTDTSGKTIGTELTSYSTKIDPSLFQPPAGAVINDSSSAAPAPSGTSEPPASTEPSPSPSA